MIAVAEIDLKVQILRTCQRTPPSTPMSAEPLLICTGLTNLALDSAEAQLAACFLHLYLCILATLFLFLPLSKLLPGFLVMLLCLIVLLE